MDFDSLIPASWYPGHMLKAQRQIVEQLRLVDLVVELVDARAPASSRNSHLEELVQHKDRVLVLAKSDLAAPEATEQWRRHFRELGLACVAVHHRQRDIARRLLPVIEKTIAQGRARRGARNKRFRATRTIVVGLPNVGKSSLINALVRRRRTKTGPRPGVTRHQQWVKVGDDVELLDTPGVMAPRLSDAETGLRLGLVAALKDEHMGEELLAKYLFYQMQGQERCEPIRFYGLRPQPDSAEELLDGICRRRGLLLGGGAPNLHLAAQTLLRDWRDGKLGCWTLELPPTEDDPA